MQTPAPGAVIGGKYRLLRPIGEGGMGAVFEAENILTLKRAAIKRLHPRVSAVEEASRRLMHEARACARIRHRNVVDVYDVMVEDGAVFLVMELLIGESLSAYLARETVYVHDLVRLLLPAMRGVSAAHAAGVVHRDIKPDNIFLVRERGGDEILPKIIDFGISLVVAADEGRLTRSGMTMGTPRYVSYEQLKGSRDVDARTDVYAFGVILYECVVGRPPYEASSLGEQAISFVTTAPPSPRSIRPELPEGLERLLVAATARDRDERIASMDSFIEQLSPYAEASYHPARLLAYAPQSSSAPRGEVACNETTAPSPPMLVTGERPLARIPVASLPSPPRARRTHRGKTKLFGIATVGLSLLGLAASRLTRDPPNPPDSTVSPAPPSTQGVADHASNSARRASHGPVIETTTSALAPVLAGSDGSVPALEPSTDHSTTSAEDSDPIGALPKRQPGDVQTRTQTVSSSTAKRAAPRPMPVRSESSAPNAPPSIPRRADPLRADEF